MAAPARDRDGWQIEPLRREAVAEALAIERASFRSPWPRQAFLDEMTKPWAHLDALQQRPGGPVVAFVNFWLVEDEVHILNVATHPDRRREGLASFLLEHVGSFARAHQAARITLEVRRSNRAAMLLYLRYGYRPVAVRPNYYADEHEDAILMILAL